MALQFRPGQSPAGLGVAVHGKPALREAAGACDDLTVWFYAQGYRREQFAVKQFTPAN